MKTTKALFLVGFLFLGCSAFAELSEADRRWSEVVEKMIVEGQTSITTPLEHRVQIARALAEKHGRKVDVIRAENSYKLVFTNLTAKN